MPENKDPLDVAEELLLEASKTVREEALVELRRVEVQVSVAKALTDIARARNDSLEPEDEPVY